MCNKGLKEKILGEIHKTGFPLELRISQVLRNNEYLVANNLYYIDRDEGKGREIDLRALKNFRFEKHDIEYFVRHYLFIECKKSIDKPWVILSSPITEYDMNVFEIDDRGFSESGKASRIIFDEKVEEIHPFKLCSRRGRSYFEAFRSSEIGEQIFKALTTSVKALIATRDTRPDDWHNDICFYYPLIVLEGKLFEAYYEHNDVCVAEAEIVIVSFFYESLKYQRQTFAVPIVTETALPNFVSKLDLVLNLWGEKLKEKSNWFY